MDHQEERDDEYRGYVTTPNKEVIPRDLTQFGITIRHKAHQRMMKLRHRFLHKESILDLAHRRAVILHIMSLESNEIDAVSYILKDLTLDNQAEYQVVVGPLITPPEMPEPLVVAPPVAPVDLGMDVVNKEDPEEDEEKSLIEHEAIIDPDWQPGNLTPWMMGDTSDKMSISDDVPLAEDQEGITSDFEADEETEIYWKILCLLRKFYM